MSQMGILIFSLAAIFLLTGEKYQRWGHVSGLLSQPFWLYATYEASQWGMFTLAFVYTFMWCRGIYNNFFKNKE